MSAFTVYFNFMLTVFVYITKCSICQIIYRSSRNRTYIGNLEGFCPNPLDDGPF